jgi:hypothetical protein
VGLRSSVIGQPDLRRGIVLGFDRQLGGKSSLTTWRSRPVSSRTRVGEVGVSWVRPVTSGAAEQWLAAVWVRDLDGRRRLVKARRRRRDEAELALQERLAQRRPLGFRGAEPNMTVQELGEYWMRRREKARAPSTGDRCVEDDGLVSLQTLAGYQAALSRIQSCVPPRAEPLVVAWGLRTCRVP